MKCATQYRTDDATHCQLVEEGITDFDKLWPCSREHCHHGQHKHTYSERSKRATEVTPFDLGGGRNIFEINNLRQEDGKINNLLLATVELNNCLHDTVEINKCKSDINNLMTKQLGKQIYLLDHSETKYFGRSPKPCPPPRLNGGPLSQDCFQNEGQLAV